MVPPVGLEPTKKNLQIKSLLLYQLSYGGMDYAGETGGSRTRVIRWTGGGNEPLYHGPWCGMQESNPQLLGS